MCRICNYNMVKTIDRLLLAGVPPWSIRRKFPFTAAELDAHHGHLRDNMARLQERFQAQLHLGLYCKLNTAMEMVLSVIRKTKGNDDVKSCLQAGREFTRIITLMDKMAARLNVDPEFIYCLLSNHQWDLQEDSHLPEGFLALASARQTLRQDLLDPCCPDSAPKPARSPAPDPRPARHTPPATPDLDLDAPPAERDSAPLPEAAAILAGPKGREPVSDKQARN